MTTLGEVSRGNEGQPHCEKLSYFARLTDAETFGRWASFEMRRRKVDHARAVAAVNDGAEWIQGFIQRHRADAVRILDFAHAAQYVGEIARLSEHAGIALPTDWRSKQLKDLKEHGPTEVLKDIQRLEERVPSAEMREKVASLWKRAEQMQYAHFLAQGWPIGSGMAESGNKHVVQARLKGAGMHWKRERVNAMLALRTTVCSDRWVEDWPVVRAGWQANRKERLRMRSQAALAQASLRLQQTFWRVPLPFLLACFPFPPHLHPFSMDGAKDTHAGDDRTSLFSPLKKGDVSTDAYAHNESSPRAEATVPRLDRSSQFALRGAPSMQKARSTIGARNKDGEESVAR